MCFILPRSQAVRRWTLNPACVSSNLTEAANYVNKGVNIMNNELLAELLFPNIEYTPFYYEEKYPERNIYKKDIVARFAPSPTGFVHMGSLYVAFLNRLFVNQYGGIFYLRVEDTDHKREVEDGIKNIKEALEWFNISLDESPFSDGAYGPYIQSMRKDIYQTYAKEMIKRGLAYPCFCTSEELDNIRNIQEKSKVRTGYYDKWASCRNLTMEEIKTRIDKNESYVIRLRTPFTSEERIECNDLVKGKIYFPTNDVDIVLLKSDGLPTYHFAHVIDDHLMHTTHVIRGDEWLSSLPIHLQLFKCLNFKTPNYIHISPLTKREENSIRKLSKRKDKEASINYYKELGIPIEALKLYFATITNSNFEEWYNQNKKLSISNFNFTFNKMSVGGTLFDIDKLNNICKTYFSLKSNEELYNESLNYFKEYDVNFYDILINNKDYALKVFNIEREISKPRKDIGCYKDIKDVNAYMFDDLFYDYLDYRKIIDGKEYDYHILDDYLNKYFTMNSEEEWYSGVKELATSFGYSKDMKSYRENPNNYKGHIGDICETIRVALTGKTQTPSLYEIQKVLGKDRIIERIVGFKNFLLEK